MLALWLLLVMVIQKYNLSCLIAAEISLHQWMYAITFVWNALSCALLLCIACGPGMMATLCAFGTEYYLFSDWLKLLRWLAAQSPLSEIIYFWVQILFVSVYKSDVSLLNFTVSESETIFYVKWSVVNFVCADISIWTQILQSEGPCHTSSCWWCRQPVLPRSSTVPLLWWALHGQWWAAAPPAPRPFLLSLLWCQQLQRVF